MRYIKMTTLFVSLIGFMSFGIEPDNKDIIERLGTLSPSALRIMRNEFPYGNVSEFRNMRQFSLELYRQEDELSELVEELTRSTKPLTGVLKEVYDRAMEAYKDLPRTKVDMKKEYDRLKAEQEASYGESFRKLKTLPDSQEPHDKFTSRILKMAELRRLLRNEDDKDVKKFKESLKNANLKDNYEELTKDIMDKDAAIMGLKASLDNTLMGMYTKAKLAECGCGTQKKDGEKAAPLKGMFDDKKTHQ